MKFLYLVIILSLILINVIDGLPKFRKNRAMKKRLSKIRTFFENSDLNRCQSLSRFKQKNQFNYINLYDSNTPDCNNFMHDLSDDPMYRPNEIDPFFGQEESIEHLFDD